jgi:hypothetical protein
MFSRWASSWIEINGGVSGDPRHARAFKAYALFFDSFIIPIYLVDIKK